LQTYEVDISDYTFAQSSDIPQLYGKASGCYASGSDCGDKHNLGSAKVNLTGTGFFISSSVSYSV